MVDTISQGIFQARRFDRTIETDALRRLHPDPVARKEHGRVHVPTFGLSCPFGPHGASHPRQFLRWILHLRYQQITPTCETAVDQLWVPCGQPERHGQRRHLGFDRACSGPAPSSASGRRQAETEIPSSLAPAGPRKTTPDDPDSTDETPHVGGPCRGGRGVNRRPIEPERQLGRRRRTAPEVADHETRRCPWSDRSSRRPLSSPSPHPSAWRDGSRRTRTSRRRRRLTHRSPGRNPRP